MDKAHQREQALKLAENFENFNPYARDASDDTEPDTQALLAIAFELSQLRYQLVRRGHNGRG